VSSGRLAAYSTSSGAFKPPSNALFLSRPD
jgi:hypothetical protein